MTALTGYLPSSGQGVLISQSPQVTTLAVGSLLLSVISRSLSNVLGVATLRAATPVALASVVVDAYVADYYNRIHTSRTLISFGTIVSAKFQQFSIWNSYFVPKTLTNIIGLPQGVSLDRSAPEVYPALKELTYTLTAATLGPPGIDATVSFYFPAALDQRIRITGERVVAFAFAPDWGAGVRERLAWSTSILQSVTGKEQRRALRISPRRTFEARLLLAGAERRLFEAQLFGWGARPFALPLWHDVQRLAAALAAGATSIACVTAGRDFRVGGKALLRGASALSIESVDVTGVAGGSLTLAQPLSGTWPAGTRLYPVVDAQLTDPPDLTRLNDRGSAITVKFQVLARNDWSALAPTTLHLGYPVLETPPEESDPLRSQFERLLLVLDNEGGIPARLDLPDLPFPVQGHRWKLFGRSAQSDFRSFLYALKGRQVPLWLPTFADDLSLATLISASTSFLDVEFCGYSRYVAARAGRRDLRIELKSGTNYHRRITQAAELPTGAERLTVSASFPANIQLADVRRISFMQLARLTDDEIELTHLTDGDGIASCALSMRAVPDEL